MAARRPLLTVVSSSVRDTVTSPSSLIPALILLLPTLVLQLVAVTHLRTRLSPTMWTVVIGGVFLIWWTQVATPVTCALVHAKRTGVSRLPIRHLVRLSLAIGTSVTFGLVLGLLPGLWLQARYAFAPLSVATKDRDGSLAAMRLSAEETRAVRLPLLLLAASALVASALGQSVVAALAEWMGTIVPVASADGRTIFELQYVSHVVTSVIAYVCAAAVLTFYAAGVSAIYGDLHGVRAPRIRRASGAGLRVRTAQAAALAMVVVAVVALLYKVQQHFH